MIRCLYDLIDVVLQKKKKYLYKYLYKYSASLAPIYFSLLILIRTR